MIPSQEPGTTDSVHYHPYLKVSRTNPDRCRMSTCGRTENHLGHCEVIRHGDHDDFIVNGRLHHVHDDHCDDHGPMQYT